MNIVNRSCAREAPSLGQVLGQFFNDPFFSEMNAPTGAPNVGALALDISEDEKSVVIRASLPGFRKEEIDVEVHEGVLTVKAQRTEETETKGERFYRRERHAGALSRRVVLPDSVSDGEVNAELKDGVLTLRIAKTPETQPKKVRIG
jgi:HSP20 family protein